MQRPENRQTNCLAPADLCFSLILNLPLQLQQHISFQRCQIILYQWYQIKESRPITISGQQMATSLTGFASRVAIPTDPPSFKERCMDILNSLKNCQLIDSFDSQDQLQELILKLDNIKLRFAIWLRLNRNVEHPLIMDILTRLGLFLLYETESTNQGRTCGMIYHEETDVEKEDLDDEEYQTPLHKHVKYHAEKYLIECETKLFLEDFCNTWIVVNSIVCLKFLAIIDGLIEELFANTRSEIGSALVHGYASAVTREMSVEDLHSIQFSGFSDTNMISQAAQSRLELQAATHISGESSVVTFTDTTDGRGSFVNPMAGTESLADSSEAILTPTTSEASLDAEERFARAADRSEESRDQILMQECPLNKLAQRRILAELRQAATAPSFARIACIENSISNLLGIISGPPDTPYERGVFFIKIEIPETYPLQAARFKFITKIYHPNIDSAGQVCVTVQDTQWAIGCSIWGLLTSIYSLLASPDTDDPLLPSIGADYKHRRELFDTTARDWTDCYANRYWPENHELLAPIPRISGFKGKNNEASKARSSERGWGELFDT